MTNLSIIHWDLHSKVECTKEILRSFKNQNWAYLTSTKDQKEFSVSSNLPKGEGGIIIASGGSIGGPSLCFQSIKNLNQSALATGKWLKTYGLDPTECIILNSLPLHHVSGFMPWWRHQTWGAQHHWISTSMMHEPRLLKKYSEALTTKLRHPLITSLVPTQLLSLIDNPYGAEWLKSLALIWIGGASIPKDLADKARRKAINLAPCYGTTETVAMVTCLNPKDFLNGCNSVGFPLEDVEIEINNNKSLKIKTSRIAISKWQNNKFESITDSYGFWEAGDLAQYVTFNNKKAVQILGRRDSAINSGGETIFPEDIEMKLKKIILIYQLQIKDILVIGVSDEKWGESLVALIRFKEKSINRNKTLSILLHMIKDWQPSNKPVKWYDCPKLSRNTNEKWELNKWKDWVDLNTPIN